MSSTELKIKKEQDIFRYKAFNSKFIESKLDQHSPEEGPKKQQPKRCDNSRKYKNNIPFANNVNDDNCSS